MDIRGIKVYIEDVDCIGETDDAILCVVEEEEIWFPKKTICRDDSEITEKGDCGLLVITKFIAEKKGLL